MTRKESEEYAKIYGATLGERADKILKMIERNRGKCPCVAGDFSPSCPCEGLVNVKEYGSCKCGLFTVKR